LLGVGELEMKAVPITVDRTDEDSTIVVTSSVDEDVKVVMVSVRK
jgi:hypothetical protein